MFMFSRCCKTVKNNRLLNTKFILYRNHSKPMENVLKTHRLVQEIYLIAQEAKPIV